MNKTFNWRPYYIGACIVALIICIFSYKIAFGIVLGSAYFYLSNVLNQKKFPSLDSKSKAIGSLMVILFVQFVMIVACALLSYYFGGLESFFGTFAGMVIPHFYFIIKELFNIKK
ncbi:MAG: hypothetical protein Q4F12_04915 [Erysipelotrichaceae bacterium]|nr:hypothetical protein [Erysipelotrichaceae bacterium]